MNRLVTGGLLLASVLLHAGAFVGPEPGNALGSHLHSLEAPVFFLFCVPASCPPTAAVLLGLSPLHQPPQSPC